jgi:hypothetical protein
MVTVWLPPAMVETSCLFGNVGGGCSGEHSGKLKIRVSMVFRILPANNVPTRLRLSCRQLLLRQGGPTHLYTTPKKVPFE